MPRFQAFLSYNLNIQPVSQTAKLAFCLILLMCLFVKQLYQFAEALLSNINWKTATKKHRFGLCGPIPSRLGKA